MRYSTIAELKQRVHGISDIPASEQALGVFHVAVQELLRDMLEHIEKLEKITGIHGA